jgi:hypothetical protein
MADKTVTALKPDEYRCAMCGSVYQLTDFDAESELVENFAGCPVDQCAIVCDDCFKGLPVKQWSENWNSLTREEQEKLNAG